MTFEQLCDFVMSKSEFLSIRDNGEAYIIMSANGQRPFTHDHIHNLTKDDRFHLERAIMNMHAAEVAQSVGGITATCRDCGGVLVMVGDVVKYHYNVSGDCIPF